MVWVLHHSYWLFYKNRKRLSSGMLTALSNRIGDCLFLCLLGFLNTHILFLLPLLSITKRAQFPYRRWLPAAIAAPTPVRALVHSSTLVTAGVYLLIRFHFLDLPIFIGSITLIIAGFCAVVERDMKKVIALRTLSQLGVMFVTLGVNEKSTCFFHLLSHAFFKALIFICVGVRIHTVYGTQDFRSFRGMHILHIVLLLVSSLSLLGFVFLSGFYSKHSIQTRLYDNSLLIFLIGSGLTCFYSIKICMNLLKTEPSLLSIGITRKIKLPLYILGFFSVTFGFASHHMNVSFVWRHDYRIYIFMFLGFYAGITLSKNSNLLSRIFTLTPNIQQLANLKVSDSEGWANLTAKSISLLSPSLLHHNVFVILGLSTLILFL